jgi:Zn-dependent M28 family amino/carboxypeptidase
MAVNLVKNLVEKYLPLVSAPRNYRNFEQMEKSVSELFSFFPDSKRIIPYKDNNLNRTFSIIEHTKKGKLNKFIIIGAHYDTFSETCPGANDNGSGVIAVLILANLFKRLHTNYSYKFVLFPNEEPPFFRTGRMGSYIYAEHVLPNDMKVEAAISIDCLGWWTDESQPKAYYRKLNNETKGDFLAFLYNKKANRIADMAIDFFAEKMKVEYFPECEFLDMTDTFAFRERGHAVINLSDTAFFRREGLYHTEDDTIHEINIPQMSHAIQNIAEFFVHIDHEAHP